MNIVLFGAGAIAREHARALHRLGDDSATDAPRVVGVYAPRADAAQTFAAELEIPTSSDDPYRYLTDPTVDAVVICSPSAMHVPQTDAALRTGKHVLCEIPIAFSVEDAIALRDLAAQQHRVLMVAHTLRVHPALMAARREIAEGRLAPLSIVARYLFLRRANVGWTGYRRSWTDNLLWHHGGHAVDTTLWLLGATSARVASEVAPAQPSQNAPLDLGIVLRTDSGNIATISLSYSSEVAIHDYTVIGRETTLRATPEQVLLPNGRQLDISGSEPPILTQDRMFLQAIQHGHSAPIAVDDILPSLRVLQAVSDTTGIWPTPEERQQTAITRTALDAGSIP